MKSFQEIRIDNLKRYSVINNPEPLNSDLELGPTKFGTRKIQVFFKHISLQSYKHIIFPNLVKKMSIGSNTLLKKIFLKSTKSCNLLRPTKKKKFITIL